MNWVTELIKISEKLGINKVVISILIGFIITLIMPVFLINFIGSKFSDKYNIQVIITMVFFSVIVIIILNPINKFFSKVRDNYSINKLIKTFTEEQIDYLLKFYNEKTKDFSLEIEFNDDDVMANGYYKLGYFNFVNSRSDYFEGSFITFELSEEMRKKLNFLNSKKKIDFKNKKIT